MPEPALLRRNRSYLLMGALPVLFALPLALGGIATGVWQLVVPSVPLGALSLLGLFLAYVQNVDPVRAPGRVAIDERGLSRDGKLLMPREEITEGVVAKVSNRTVLRLHRKGSLGTVSVEVESDEAARTMLHELGLDPSQHVSELRGASQILTWSLKKHLLYTLAPMFLGFFPLSMIAMTFGIRGIPFAMTAYLGMFAWMFAISFTPTRVTVGVDGVMTRWFRSERFVPFSEVDKVDTYQQAKGGKLYVGVELSLKDGSNVRIPTGQEGFSMRSPDALLARIREGLALHRESRGASLDPSLFARQGRDGPTWVTSLRAIGSGAADDLRRASVSAERLLDVLDDASASASARVGAAVAAMASSPAATKTRLRVAARTTASPRLRVALEKVEGAGDDEAALAEALAEVEEDEDRETRPEHEDRA